VSLVLTIEHGPHAQAVRQTRLDEGDLVIGRGVDADWRIEDPDQFVSRAHCRITAERNGYFITDTSSSGLFIDDSGSPLGQGNSARLCNGMRLRLGDYVLCVSLGGGDGGNGRVAAVDAPSDLRSPQNSGSDDFFSARSEEEPAPPRPADLPDPFERPVAGAYRNAGEGGGDGLRSAAFDDPFSLDPLPAPNPDDDIPSAYGSGRGDAFFLGSQPSDRRQPVAARTATEWTDSDAAGFGFGNPAQPGTDRDSRPAAHHDRMPNVQAGSRAMREPPDQRDASPAGLPRAAQLHPDPALREAFLRGLGLDQANLPDHDQLAEMERFGRQYRLMMDGLMQLLRKRAEEKGNARVAQTVVGASAVNPLKFLPTIDDALATITAGRSAGFLQGDEAIADAVRDLAEHHMRAWRGVQGALRRMIDRFDPVAFERELKSTSALDKVLAGGRGAKLWELYKKRHREIATSAEQRFLGEIGVDFRDAYEEE